MFGQHKYILLLSMIRNLHIFLLLFICYFPVFAQSNTQSNGNMPLRFVVKFKKQHIRNGRVEYASQMLKNEMQVSEVSSLFNESATPLPSSLSGLYEIQLKKGQNVQDAIQQLYNRDLIEYAEPITYYEKLSPPPFIPNDYYYVKGDLWGLQKAKVPEAWELSKGDSNIVIGIIDDYVWTAHPEFRGQMKYNHKERYGIRNFDDDGNGFVDDSLGFDFAEGNNKITGWHGTAVAGISSAKVNNTIGVAGVGFNCRFMPIKVVDEKQDILNINIVKAIKYAADNGCKIINLSLKKTVTIFSQLEQDVINYATSKGVLVIAAAGNNMGEIDAYPASYNHVLSVGASDENDRNVRAYSNFIDILAPGKLIRTTYIQDDYTEGHEGTSFAVPFVAGAAGLVKARFPDFTPLQIAAQLRATADDVYQVAGNSAFAEKLGKGRINVLRAVQDRNIAQAVKSQNHKFTDKFGNYAFYDDTVSLVCDFVNYLKPSTKALKATLSTSSPYVIILKNTVPVGALKTLDSVNNAKNPFVVYIKPETPPATTIKFRIGFEDNGYTDYQYFNITTSPNYLNIYANELALTSAADGRIGMVGQEGNNGIGITYKGKQYLSDAGLMISTSPSKVANGVYVNPTTRANDFSTVSHIKFTNKDLQSITATAIIKETSKIGLEVKQTIKGRINTPHRQYVLVEYEITNQSGSNIDSMSVGLFADWNIETGNYNFADWDSQGQFGYISQTNLNTFLGVKVIDNSPQYYAIDKSTSDGKINWADGFSDAEKHTALNNSLAQKQAGYSSLGGTDVAQVISAKIKQLPNGQSKKVIFAILAGNSIDELRKAAAQATLMANPNTPKGAKPIVPTMLCKDKTMQVKPQNGTKFRFYEENNLQEPKLEGKEIIVTLADTSKIFYISNVDSLLESDLLKYQFKAHQAKASFQSVDSLNLVDSSLVYFYDKSVKAVKWSWDFGDKSELDTLKNPKHEYKQAGLYKVVLNIVDSIGCASSFSKNIRVVRLRRSPTPILNQYEIFACRVAPISITPVNGRNFKFYSSLNLPPIYIGKTLILKDINVKQVYITNTDSTFESLPTVLIIKRGNLKADFDYSPKADIILNSQIKFTDLSLSNLFINRWEWDFGDGSPIDFEKNPTHRFDRQGIYKILLKVSDLSGCTDTISKFFKIGSKAPKPIVVNQIVCKGATASISPTGGTKFNFYTSLPLKTPVFQGQSYSFMPLQSQLLYVTSADSIVESDYQTVSVEINEPFANFEAPAEILLYRPNNSADFRDLSKNAVAWLWNFGDGSPTVNVRNPNYTYKKQGEYTVTLSIRDKYDCNAFVSKKIKVINRASPPVISGVTICKDVEVILRPTGGTKFRFYEIFPSSIVAFTGSSWNLGKVIMSKTYYVTNADSLHESEATKVEVKVDEINAAYEVKTPSSEVYANDSIQFKALAENAISWEWFFGDGTSSNARNPIHIYQNAGNYSLSLTTRNITGCVASSTTAFTVKAKAMIPTNVQLYLYPNPTEGDVRVEVNASKLTPVYVEIYNNIGQSIRTFTQEMVKNEIYEFSLKGYQKGLYILRFTFDGQTYIKKIVHQ